MQQMEAIIYVLSFKEPQLLVIIPIFCLIKSNAVTRVYGVDNIKGSLKRQLQPPSFITLSDLSFPAQLNYTSTWGSGPQNVVLMRANNGAEERKSVINGSGGFSAATS